MRPALWFIWSLRYWTLGHMIRHFGQKYRPKSPLEVYNTIITYRFGVENYTYNRGKFKRKKSK